MSNVSVNSFVDKSFKSLKIQIKSVFYIYPCVGNVEMLTAISFEQQQSVYIWSFFSQFASNNRPVPCWDVFS